MGTPYGKLFTQLFLDHGCDPNVTSSPQHLTPLHVAVIYGQEDTLKILVNAGGMVDLLIYSIIYSVFWQFVQGEQY